MAWIYLAESAESNRPWRHGCELSPTVNESQALSASYFPGCIEVKSNSHLSGTTLPLFADPCSLQLTSSLADFHARTLALRAFEKAWAARGLDFSAISLGLPKKQVPLFFSSKTSEVFLNSFRLSGLRLKHWGMKFGTDLLQPATSGQDTDESAGLLWPTLVVSRKTYDRQRDGSRTYSLPALWKMGKLPILTAREYRSAGHKSDMERKSPSVSSYWKATTGTNIPVSFCEWIMGYSIGATRSEPWATQWFRRKPKRPSNSSQELGA